MSEYYQKVKIPIRLIGYQKRKNKIVLLGKGLKTACSLVLLIAMIIVQTGFFSAFEAHIINVTAHICNYSETRSKGYWQNHPEVYDPALLPQTLGGIGSEDLLINSQAKVNKVFNDYNLSMRNELRGQDLAMKFNIAKFSIGGFEYFVSGLGTTTMDNLVVYADGLLSTNPAPPDSVLENIKDALDTINNLHQIKYCGGGGQGGPEPGIVINEVYYDVDSRTACGPTESDPLNEWIEIYNPTDEAVNISGWTIEDNASQNTIPLSPSIPAGGFAVISDTNFTWQFWNVPDSAIKIQLGGTIGNGLDNDGDRVILRDLDGKIVDQMSYENDHSVWNPAPPLDINGDPYNLPKGDSLSRNPDGFDTDNADDFVDTALPTPGGELLIPKVRVIVPNGGEIWHLGGNYNLLWSAVDPVGDSSALSIDIWYSKDSGQTWFYKIAENLPNTGSYNWIIPINDALIGSHARIRVIATTPEGLVGWDKSDCDFCPPIDEDITVADETMDSSTSTDEKIAVEDSSATEEISSVTEEVSNDNATTVIEEMATTTEKVTDLSEETASSTEEIATTTEEIATTTEEIASSTEETVAPVAENDSSSHENQSDSGIIEQVPVIEEQAAIVPENIPIEPDSGVSE